MDETHSPFEGFPLTGLIRLRQDYGRDEVPIEQSPAAAALHLTSGSDWVAVLRRPRTTPDGGTAPGPVEEVDVPGVIIHEVQGKDPYAPVYTLHLSEPDPWKQVQVKLNEAAERVATKLV